MFKLQPNPTFKAPVEIHVAGQAKPARIEVEFKYLKRDEMADFFSTLSGRKDEDALADIVVGWSGVDAPYSVEALAQLLNNYLPAARALFDAFMTGLNEAKEKN